MNFQDNEAPQKLYVPSQEIIYREDNPEILSDSDNDESDSESEENLSTIDLLSNCSKPEAELKSEPNPEFQATVSTYESDHNLPLYDNESKDITQLQYRFDQNCYVYRYKIKQKIFVDFLTHQEVRMGKLPHQSAELLFEIKLQTSLIEKGKKFFMIFPNKFSKQEQKATLNTRQDKRIYKSIQRKTKSFGFSDSYRIQKDDEIRFGLETFKVSDIYRSEDTHERQEKEQISNLLRKKYWDFPCFSDQKIQQITCKICLNNENNFHDPLISPCLCKGSCQYVHFSCLRTWLDNFLYKYTSSVIDCYKWAKFYCELCKYPYSLQFSYRGNTLPLAQFEIPNSPFIVFERINSGCIKQIVVVKGQRYLINVGRSANCDFKIISTKVSEYHASIGFDGDQFYLKDLETKYGTLVRINQPIKVEEKLKIQVGDLQIRFDPVVNKNGKNYVWKYE